MKKYAVLFFILILSAPPIAFAESDGDNAENNFHQGTIQWIDKCITIASGTSIVRVIDHDMNKDPTKIEHFDIEMGSDSDRREKSMTVTETGKDTGIFEGTVFFFTNDDDGSSHRVRISVGDTVFARYVDENPAKYSIDNIPTDNSGMVLVAEIPVLESLKNNKKHTIEYGPCTISHVDTVKKTHSPKLEMFYPAPLKQIESGLSLDEIKCKENSELILRYDDSPACVKPESIQKLIERGWATEHVVLEQKKNTTSNNKIINNNEWTASYYLNYLPLPNGEFEKNTEKVILWNMLDELEKHGIENWRNDPDIGENTDEGWINPSKLCSKILLEEKEDDSKELYVSAAFYSEPELNITEIVIDDLKPTSCQKWFPIPYEIKFEDVVKF